MVWAEQFWIFWKLAKAIKISKIMILVHMDNKCFSAIKCRTNQKVVTSEEELPHDFIVHYKSRIGKELYIVLTAFLPTDNDIIKCGLAKYLSLIQTERMIKAKKDS